MTNILNNFIIANSSVLHSIDAPVGYHTFYSYARKLHTYYRINIIEDRFDKPLVIS